MIYHRPIFVQVVALVAFCIPVLHAADAGADTEAGTPTNGAAGGNLARLLADDLPLPYDWYFHVDRTLRSVVGESHASYVFSFDDHHASHSFSFPYHHHSHSFSFDYPGSFSYSFSFNFDDDKEHGDGDGQDNENDGNNDEGLPDVSGSISLEVNSKPQQQPSSFFFKVLFNFLFKTDKNNQTKDGKGTRITVTTATTEQQQQQHRHHYEAPRRALEQEKQQNGKGKNLFVSQFPWIFAAGGAGLVLTLWGVALLVWWKQTTTSKKAIRKVKPTSPGAASST